MRTNTAATVLTVLAFVCAAEAVLSDDTRADIEETDNEDVQRRKIDKEFELLTDIRNRLYANAERRSKTAGGESENGKKLVQDEKKNDVDRKDASVIQNKKDDDVTGKKLLQRMYDVITRELHDKRGESDTDAGAEAEKRDWWMDDGGNKGLIAAMAAAPPARKTAPCTKQKTSEANSAPGRFRWKSLLANWKKTY